MVNFLNDSKEDTSVSVGHLSEKHQASLHHNAASSKDCRGYFAKSMDFRLVSHQWM